MSGSITVAAVQAAPLALEGLPVFGRDDTVAAFADDVMRVRAAVSGPALLVYPEIHLFGTEDTRLLASAAEPLDGPLTAALGEIARAADAWLIPGSVFELGENGEIFNTAPVFAPDGQLVASYRKTVHAYPGGGGAYAVAKDNFGQKAALVAASALVVSVAGGLLL